ATATMPASNSGACAENAPSDAVSQQLNQVGREVWYEDQWLNTSRGEGGEVAWRARRCPAGGLRERRGHAALVPVVRHSHRSKSRPCPGILRETDAEHPRAVAVGA